MNLNDDQSKLANESAEKGDYDAEFDNAVRYVRCLLRLVGIWPLVASKPTKNEYMLSKRVLIPFVSVLMISLTVPICYYVITRPVGRLETIVLLGPITFQCGNILMHFAMVMRSSSIKICVEHMKLDWGRIEGSKEHDIMTRYSGFSHALAVTCLFSIYSSAVLYSLVMPLLSGSTINELNETIRPRPFPGTEIFFDVQASVVYEIVFAINFISALLHCTVTTAVCVLAIVLVSHACGQIQIVMSKLNGFVDRNYDSDDSGHFVTKQMGFTIRRHVRLLEFSMNIEKTLKEMMLMEVVAVTLMICFIEYDVLIILEANDSDRMGILSYVMLFISFEFNLFLYCQFGEILKGQCEKIGKIAYLIDWLGLPGKTKLALIMIINMSNHPCKLTAGGMMELSRVNFAGILKTSFAYFNMMRTMG